MKESQLVSDHELITMFKNGKLEVFDEFINRYSGKLYQTAYALLNNHHDAQEVVQDALVRAYRALPQFRGDSSLNTWLQRIVTNLSRNKYHWNRRRGSEKNQSLSRLDEQSGENSGDEINLPDTKNVPDEQAKVNELEDILNDGFEHLPESVRETMTLRHIHDYSYEEISKILNCKIGTVKSRIARGREIMMNMLKKQDLF